MNSDSPQTNSNGDVNEQVTIEANVPDSATANAEDGNSTTQVDTASSSGEIESLKAQLDERSSQYMRIAADFENYRKRTLKEKDDLELQVKRNTITELLPIIDNFERARAQIKPQNDGEMAIHKSYQGVYKQLVDCLKRLGVSPMRPEGQEFDPNEHEAVMREPTDEYPEGTVLEELVRGYFLGERVLRHAMVKVAAQKEDASSAEDSEPGEEST
ncbi:MAG: nucleotide exchange factor GrpE [Cyanobacteria bacterium P01_A01_bin.80]